VSACIATVRQLSSPVTRHAAELTARLTRAAAESTNDRIKYWSIVQTVMLFAVCGWQVFYLKRFFEVKRSV